MAAQNGTNRLSLIEDLEQVAIDLTPLLKAEGKQTLV